MAEPSWAVDDLDALFAAGFKTPETTVLERTDGLNLLYAERIHIFFGLPGNGKSWAALLATLQEIKKGKYVLYLDFEASSKNVAQKLLQLGLTESEIRKQFRYKRVWDAYNEENDAYLAELLGSEDFTLVVMDGVTEYFSLMGLNDYLNREVATAFRVPHYIASLGPAVVLVDHVSKTSNNNSNDAIGSGHKRASTDGAMYRFENDAPIAKGKVGRSRLYLTKDKESTVQSAVGADQLVGILWADCDNSGAMNARIELPTAAPTVTGTPGAPNLALAKRLLQHVKSNPGQSKNYHAEKVPGGNKVEKLAVMDWLEKNGHIKNGSITNHSKYEFVSDFEEVTGLEDFA